MRSWATSLVGDPQPPAQYRLRCVVGDAGNRRAAVGGPEEGQREEGRPGWRVVGVGFRRENRAALWSGQVRSQAQSLASSLQWEFREPTPLAASVRKIPQVSKAADVSMRLCGDSKGCRVPRPAQASASSR